MHYNFYRYLQCPAAALLWLWDTISQSLVSSIYVILTTKTPALTNGKSRHCHHLQPVTFTIFQPVFQTPTPQPGALAAFLHPRGPAEVPFPPVKCCPITQRGRWEWLGALKPRNARQGPLHWGTQDRAGPCHPTEQPGLVRHHVKLKNVCLHTHICINSMVKISAVV